MYVFITSDTEFFRLCNQLSELNRGNGEMKNFGDVIGP